MSSNGIEKRDSREIFFLASFPIAKHKNNNHSNTKVNAFLNFKKTHECRNIHGVHI